MDPAPIVLFVYKRPWHTQQTLAALQKNNLAASSKLIVYLDGLKPGSTAEARKQQQEIIELVENLHGFASVELIKSEVNKGLASSVIEGVSEVLSKYKKIIVLEDDLVCSPLFLEFMNNALINYEKNPEVVCISGYVYPLAEKLSSSFFLKGADCWGWATWEDKWQSTFRLDAQQLYNEISQSTQRADFDFNGSYPYTEMLLDCVQGKNQSWAIRWYAGAFLKNKYCLYPPKSFVHNIGNDGSGSHSEEATDKFNAALETTSIPGFPATIKENPKGRLAFEQFFRELTGNKKNGLIALLKQKIKSLFAE